MRWRSVLLVLALPLALGSPGRDAGTSRRSEATGPISAYVGDFEALSASPSGVVLTGQGGFYDDRTGSERLDFEVYTYAGNDLGFSQNPTGGNQFIAGVQSGSDTWAVVKRDLNFDGGEWDIAFDVAVSFIGEVPVWPETSGFGLDAYHAGGFWLRPSEPATARFDVTFGWGPENEHGYYETQHVHVLYEASEADGSGFISKPTDWQFSMPGMAPGPAWEGIPKNHWHRISTSVDFDANTILSVSIKDLEANSWVVHSPSDWYLRGGPAGGLPLPSQLMLAAAVAWPDPINPFDPGIGSVIAFDNIHMVRLPENPTLTSQTHARGQTSCDQNLTVEWNAPYAYGGVGGYSYVIVDQDDPFYDVNRTPDGVIDLSASTTSFTTSLLTPGLWEFNIKTIDSQGTPARFYASFWVDIADCAVNITRPRNGDRFAPSEWVNVFWDALSHGGNDVTGGYDVGRLDLLQGPTVVANLVTNQPNILSSGFSVPDVGSGSNYGVRLILERNSAGDMVATLPETMVGLSELFAVVNPVTVDVTSSDASGNFSVTIDAGTAKGAPVTSWTEVSSTNIASYTVTLTNADMTMIIDGQLQDPSVAGQLVLDVDPVGEITRYEANITPYEGRVWPFWVLVVAVVVVIAWFIRLFRQRSANP